MPFYFLGRKKIAAQSEYEIFAVCGDDSLFEMDS